LDSGIAKFRTAAAISPSTLPADGPASIAVRAATRGSEDGGQRTPRCRDGKDLIVQKWPDDDRVVGGLGVVTGLTERNVDGA